MNIPAKLLASFTAVVVLSAVPSLANEEAEPASADEPREIEIAVIRVQRRDAIEYSWGEQNDVDELTYSVKGENITLYNGETELATVTNTVKDMGDFFDDAVWLGEQISYNINGDSLFVLAQPGVNFVTGKVLHYDDMPAITALVTFNNDGGFTLSNISVSQSSN